MTQCCFAATASASHHTSCCHNQLLKGTVRGGNDQKEQSVSGWGFFTLKTLGNIWLKRFCLQTVELKMWLQDVSQKLQMLFIYQGTTGLQYRSTKGYCAGKTCLSGCLRVDHWTTWPWWSCQGARFEYIWGVWSNSAKVQLRISFMLKFSGCGWYTLKLPFLSIWGGGFHSKSWCRDGKNSMAKIETWSDQVWFAAGLHS